MPYKSRPPGRFSLPSYHNSKTSIIDIQLIHMMLSAMSTTVNNILSFIWTLVAFASYFHSSSNRNVGLLLKDDGLGMEEHGKVSSLRIRGRTAVSFVVGKCESVKIHIAPIVSNLRLPSSYEVAGTSHEWADVERADQAPPVPTEEQASARIGYFYPASTCEAAEAPAEHINIKQEKQGTVIITKQNTHSAEADEISPPIINITPAIASKPIQDTDRFNSSPVNPPLVRSSLSRLAYPESQDPPLPAVNPIATDHQPEVADPRPWRPRSAVLRPAVFTTVPKLRSCALAVLERKRLAASMDTTACFPVSFPVEESTEAFSEDILMETIAPTPTTLEDIQEYIKIDDASSRSDEDADDEGDDIDNVSEYSEPWARVMSPSVCSSPSSELDMDGVLGCDDLASVCLEPHPTSRDSPSLSFNAQGNSTHEWDPSPTLDYPSSPTGSCSSYSSGSSASSISPPPTPRFDEFTTSRPSLESRLSAVCQSSKVAMPDGTPSLVKATTPRDIFAGFRSRLSSIRWTDFIPDDDSDDEDGNEDHGWVPPTREWPFNDPEDVPLPADIFIIGDCSDEE
ncbi:hypothetical protein BD779DRAFT_1550121 [Infundibulicybe gibba]|nr:hypothetical protein BD779DRAFT_1550121 [Infundibulicybe gibba]